MSELTFDVQIERASAACISHDYDLATKILENCLKSDPENIRVLSELGRVYVCAGNDNQALKYYGRVYELDDQNFNAMNNLGSIFRRLNKNEQSVDILNKAFAVAPKPVLVHYNLGQTYKAMNRYEDAITEFQAVLDETPQDVLAHNHLGCIYAAMGDHESALNMFGRALLIDENHPILHFNAAVSYEAIGRYNDAAEAYENALRKKPGWSEAMQSYAELLQHMGKNDQAETLLRQAINRTYKNPDLHSSLGDLLFERERVDDADGEYNVALSINKDHIKAIGGKVNVLEKKGRSDEAYDLLMKMEQLVPEDATVSMRCAELLMNMKNYDEASKRLQNVLQKQPENPDAQCLMGEYLLAKGDETGAHQYFEKAIKAKPENISHRFSAAKRLYDLGNYEAAEVQMRHYLAARPGDVSAWLYLSTLYIELGESENAVKVLKKVQTLDPSNSELLNAANRLKNAFSGDSMVEDFVQSLLGKTQGNSSDLEKLSSAISAYEQSVENLPEETSDDFEKNLRLLGQTGEAYESYDAPIESPVTEYMDEDIDLTAGYDEMTLSDPADRPASIDDMAEDDFSEFSAIEGDFEDDPAFADDGFDSLRDSSADDDMPIDFDVTEEDFNKTDDDGFESLVLGEGDDVPIDIDPAENKKPFDPERAVGGRGGDNDDFEEEEVYDLDRNQVVPPNQNQPPYTPPQTDYPAQPQQPQTPPPVPQYQPPPQPQVIYQQIPVPQYRPDPLANIPMPPMPKPAPNPELENLRLDAELNQKLDEQMMKLAAEAQAKADFDHEAANAKRREMQETIRRALEKLREQSEESADPKQESIADMFSYMRGLCNYLPQPKKALFMSSEERVQLEYVINKLKNKPGLLNESAAVVKAVEETGEDSADFVKRLDNAGDQNAKLSASEISDAILHLQDIALANMQDKDLISALQSKVRKVLTRCDDENVNWQGENSAPDTLLEKTEEAAASAEKAGTAESDGVLEQTFEQTIEETVPAGDDFAMQPAAGTEITDNFEAGEDYNLAEEITVTEGAEEGFETISVTESDADPFAETQEPAASESFEPVMEEEIPDAGVFVTSMDDDDFSISDSDGDIAEKDRDFDRLLGL